MLMAVFPAKICKLDKHRDYMPHKAKIFTLWSFRISYQYKVEQLKTNLEYNFLYKSKTK